MSKVLIAGFGDVGQQLAGELVKAGHQVWGIKRNPLPDFEAGISNKSASCKLILADLGKPETLQQIPQDIDFLVYCPTPDAEQSTAEGYRNIFVNGLRNALGAINTSRLQRAFFISSTGVYGQSQGEWVDELSETFPARFSGRVLLEAERFLQQQPVPATVIRLAGIYGPGRHQLLKKLLQGKLPIEPLAIYTNRIHRDDAARMIHFLIEQDNKNKVVDKLYIGVDDKPCSKGEIATWLFQHLSDKFGMQSAPPLQNKGDQDNLKQNKRCSNQKIKQAGFGFKYADYTSGYKAVLDQLTDLNELL